MVDASVQTDLEATDRICRANAVAVTHVAAERSATSSALSSPNVPQSTTGQSTTMVHTIPTPVGNSTAFLNGTGGGIASARTGESCELSESLQLQSQRQPQHSHPSQQIQQNQPHCQRRRRESHTWRHDLPPPTVDAEESNTSRVPPTLGGVIPQSTDSDGNHLVDAVAPPLVRVKTMVEGEPPGAGGPSRDLFWLVLYSKDQ